MYEELVRPMIDREREELQNALRRIESCDNTGLHNVKWIALWLAGLVIGSLLFLLPFILDLLADDASLVLYVGAIIYFLVLIAFLMLCLFGFINGINYFFDSIRMKRMARRKTAPRIRAALEHGRVSVKRVEATAVVQVDEFEDEGSAFIYEIGYGSLLILKGQDYYPIDEEMPWPNTKFEIVRSAANSMEIGIFCDGRYLKPQLVLEATECREDFQLSEYEEVVENTTLEQYVASIRQPT